MRELFEDKLRSKIKDTLQDYEAPFDPKDWESMRGMLDESKRSSKQVIWKKYSRAAAILLPVGAMLGFLALENINQDNNIPVVAGNQVTEENANTTFPIDNRDAIVLDGANKASISLENESVKNKPSKAMFSNEKEAIVYDYVNNEVTTTDIVNNNERGINGDIPTKNGTTVVAARNNSNEGSVLIPENEEYSAIGNEENPLQSIVVIKKESVVSTPERLEREEEEVNVNDLYKEEYQLADKDIDEDNEKKNNPVTFGVAFTQQTNTAEFNHESDWNIGGGVITEIPINEKLDIYTGMMVGNNSLDFGGETDITSPGRHLESATMNVVSMDLPINLKYNLKDGKNSNFYLVAGVSSMAYLKERYQYDYVETSTFSTVVAVLEEPTGSGPGGQSEPTVVFKEVQQIEQEQESNPSEVGAFQNIDLAKLVNLSFGVEYKLSDSYHILIEPYYKLPLGALAQEQIRFGAGGVNMRLNFGSQKNK